jgi:hypothetical protein
MDLPVTVTRSPAYYDDNGATLSLGVMAEQLATTDNNNTNNNNNNNKCVCNNNRVYTRLRRHMSVAENYFYQSLFDLIASLVYQRR